ncbi:hypothetical protein [Vibrio ziniensis]|uniref:Uncharacterized protein n=1 Tax=Vibrio ziniensis TaxID=2711221 RepID=A0A6G7CPQ0_9VIBR|nr:hypothetical protein [Vibrio ziniensis]QIH44059.1 hypothetical protein G5S32_19000 [Vibrio ziniensis]
MKRYGTTSPLLLLGALMSTHAQASGSQVDIELGCVTVANKDVSIKTGDCNTRRVETVERVKVVKVVEEDHYYGHPVHGKHPGKKKGHNKETYILVPVDKHKH